MTITEGKWFEPGPKDLCNAYMLLPSPGCSFLVRCHLPKGHAGVHEGWCASGSGDGRKTLETWTDREADTDNRAYWRKLKRAYDGTELPYEEGM